MHQGGTPHLLLRLLRRRRHVRLRPGRAVLHGFVRKVLLRLLRRRWQVPRLPADRSVLLSAGAGPVLLRLLPPILQYVHAALRPQRCDRVHPELRVSRELVWALFCAAADVDGAPQQHILMGMVVHGWGSCMQCCTHRWSLLLAGVEPMAAGPHAACICPTRTAAVAAPSTATLAPALRAQSSGRRALSTTNVSLRTPLKGAPMLGGAAVGVL